MLQEHRQQVTQPFHTPTVQSNNMHGKATRPRNDGTKEVPLLKRYRYTRGTVTQERDAATKKVLLRKRYCYIRER